MANIASYECMLVGFQGVNGGNIDVWYHFFNNINMGYSRWFVFLFYLTHHLMRVSCWFGNYYVFLAFSFLPFSLFLDLWTMGIYLFQVFFPLPLLCFSKCQLNYKANAIKYFNHTQRKNIFDHTSPSSQTHSFNESNISLNISKDT